MKYKFYAPLYGICFRQISILHMWVARNNLKNGINQEMIQNDSFFHYRALRLYANYIYVTTKITVNIPNVSQRNDEICLVKE